MRLKIITLQSSLISILLITSCAEFTRNAETSQPVAIATPTKTVTNTPTIIPTNTVTAIPTFTEEEARNQLLILLAENGGCDLPCVWGITPGKSIYKDAQDILNPLVSIASDPIFMDSSSPISIDPSYIVGDSEIDVHLAFLYGNDDIVSHIAFQARVSKKVVAPGGGWMSQDIFDSKTFGERVRAYMLPQVLTEQGLPAAVLLHTAGTLVKDSGGFRILLFYPEQGLAIHYETQMKIINDKVQGCFANAHVEMELYPSGDPESFSSNLDLTYWADLWPIFIDNIFWKPIEKATSMSLEQFYEIYSKSTNMCIETPINIWPTP